MDPDDVGRRDAPGGSTHTVDPDDGHVVDLTRAGPAVTGDEPPSTVHASISVGGDLTGQVAIGNDIVQMRIDTLHGNIVTIAPPAAAPVVTRRPTPVRMLPRAPAVFVDREQERARLLAALLEREAVDLVGPRGTGKSTLLRHLANHPRLAAVRDGVVHLSVADETPGDLGQSLFDVFHATSTPYKPSAGEIRQRLQEIDAALLLDDVALTGDEAERVVDLLPTSGVVMASEEPVLARTLRLHGLPGEDAARLASDVAHVERPAAMRLVAEAGTDPLALRRAAAAVGQPPLDERERGVLALLLAVPGLRLDARQLARVAAMDEVEAILERLSARGLVQRHAGRAGAPERFAAAQGPAAVVAGDEVAAGRETLRAFALAWARRHRTSVLLAPNDLDAALHLLADAERRGDAELGAPLALACEAALALTGRWDAWSRTLARLAEAAVRTDAAPLRAYALHQQGVLALISGRPQAAASLLGEALAIRERLGDQEGAAVTRSGLDVLSSMAPQVPTPPSAPPRPDGLPPWATILLVLVALVGLTALVVALAAGGVLDRDVDPGDVPAGSPTERPDEEVPAESPGEGPGEGPGEPDEAPGDDDAEVAVTVPGLVGLEVGEARSRLADLGLGAAVSQVDVDGVAGGTVVDQTPEGGTQVAPGAEVRLVVAREDDEAPPGETVEVPDVVRSEAPAAAAEIEAAGLVPQRELVQDVEGLPPGVVAAQEPRGGETVERGETVTLFIVDEPIVVD
jgi:hypothetical protein